LLSFGVALMYWIFFNLPRCMMPSLSVFKVFYFSSW
jgi:hypothetical protein